MALSAVLPSLSQIVWRCRNPLSIFTSNSMDTSEVIDLSSSDSDVEIGHEATNASAFRGPSNSRVLPQWPNSHGSNSKYQGSGRQTQKVPASGRGYSQNLSSANGSRMKGPMRHDNTGDSAAPSGVVLLDDDSGHLSGNGSAGPSWKVNSRISNGSSTDFEKLSSQQALRRTLPPSFQSSGPSKRPINLSQHANGIWNPETQRNSYGYGVPNLVDRKSFSRDVHGRGSGTESVLYENGGNRVLPPSMQGKPGFTPFVGPSDPMIRTHINDERINGNDERVIYQEAIQTLSQPRMEANLPDGVLSVSLLRHQKIALYWMLQREKATHCLGGILADDQGLGKTISVIALIQMQRSLQSKFNSEDNCNTKTEALNLDDDVDIDSGRTNNLKRFAECEDIKPVPEVGTSASITRRQRPKAGTLVVCPASVLRQWARELDEKVSEENKLSVLIYHGGNRTRDPAELAKYDVVLTTYAIVTNEVPKQPTVDEVEPDEKNSDEYGLSSEFAASKRKTKMYNSSKQGKKGRKGMDSSFIDSDCGALAKVGWFRVVLDEAQTIKNHRTQVARACCSLRAKSRWCLSGTPIQNSIDDLYSYFRFLKYDPYSNFKLFHMKIKYAIQRNSIDGYKKLQAVLKIIMLRRTKGTLLDGKPIVNLPPKTVRLNKVDFSQEERAFYAQLEANSRSQFKAYAAAGTLSQNYANILLMLLRLRQACDHPVLVRGYYSDSVGKVSLGMAKKLPREMLIDLINKLETSLALCQVCNDPPEDPVVTMCGHVFCYQCVSEHLTGDDNLCPATRCKEHIGADVVFSKATLRSCISDDLDSNPTQSQFSAEEVMQNEYTSSKITAVVAILQSLLSENNLGAEHGFSEAASSSAVGPSTGNIESDVCVLKHTTVYSRAPAEAPVKAIVFSQWTSMLNLVEFSLNQYCIQYRRLDGTMSLAARDRAVKEFNTDPEVGVMLMSLKAGNLGLNMVAACHVILLDLWWNPTTEDQAIDRAHRIGQTRPVTVTRLTIKDTVEDRILALQEEKRKIVSSAFGEEGGVISESRNRLSVEDLRYLFAL